jgi:uncharacterized alpha-E superfamily protein
MLSRIGHDLYWLGRNMVRAEHTARMLDGLFHSDLQARPEDPESVTLSWDSMLVIMGADSELDPERPALRSDVAARLTLDPATPNSIVSCVAAAREGARTLRDTISAEMWEAINTFNLDLQRRDLSAGVRTGPYSIYSYVKERCGLFWGLTSRTMLKDGARAFLIAGGRIESADMVLRMLRVALPPIREGDEEEAPRRDGNALALLHAVGGFQAFMRSAATPPNADPVARFLIFERGFPDSVAASAESLHDALVNGDSDWRESAPILRLARLTADLEFRARAGREALIPAFRLFQHELELVDSEIDERYFSGVGQGAPA